VLIIVSGGGEDDATAADIPAAKNNQKNLAQIELADYYYK